MQRTIFERAGLELSLAQSGDGQTCIFQHGLCGDAKQPAEVFPSGAGWRLLTLECRGHGSSEAGDPKHFSIATFADDLISVIERYDLAPVVLGGISMGAAVSLRIAVTRPDLMRALILARPAWIDGDAPPNMQPNAFVGHLLERYPPPDALSRFEESDVARRLVAEGPDNLASLRGFFGREPAAVTAALLTQISADGPGLTVEQIASIRVPTLVIGHERDVVHSLALAQELAVAIPGSRLVEITPKAVSKALYIKDFSEALTSFLDMLKGTVQTPPSVSP